jgi:diadenosine tetraphosphatase ApaH/serine/threonine PP2A family protein phosphatase
LSSATKVAEKIANHEFDISKKEIDILTREVMHVNGDKPNIIEVPKNKFIFVGDLHGELDSILRVQSMIKKYRDYCFIFLGDYADRGSQQITTINLVLSLHLLNPGRVVLLRGNHESEEIASRYGFEMAVRRQFDQSTFNYYLRVFKSIPMGAITTNAIFAVHGGIPQGVASLKEMQEPDRHHYNFPNDILFQMVWNDPQDADFGFRPNMRSTKARTFGQRAFERFSQDIGVDLIVRAHEAYREGFQEYFGGGLLGVFSASYQGQSSPKVLRIKRNKKFEVIALNA